MHRFVFLMFLLVAFPACAAQPATDQAEREAEVAPPNIILFLVDDMGWQDTSVQFGPERTFWNDHYRTPNMQRLADRGVKFTNAYATPVCTPTRVSLITGMNAARHKVTNWTSPYNGTDSGKWLRRGRISGLPNSRSRNDYLLYQLVLRRGQRG